MGDEDFWDSFTSGGAQGMVDPNYNWGSWGVADPGLRVAEAGGMGDFEGVNDADLRMGDTGELDEFGNPVGGSQSQTVYGPDGSVTELDPSQFTDPAISADWVQKALKALSSSGSKAGTTGGIADIIKNLLGSAMSVGSGIYGMTLADDTRRLGEQAAKMSDPWGTSGGRSLADTQLQQLMRDPSGTMQNDPLFKAKVQAAQRANAGYGQDSGKMAVAAADAGGDWYDTRLKELSPLAGTQFNPGAGQAIAMQGQISSNDLASKSLASVGYGVTRATGGGTSGSSNSDLLNALLLNARTRWGSNSGYFGAAA